MCISQGYNLYRTKGLDMFRDAQIMWTKQEFLRKDGFGLEYTGEHTNVNINNTESEISHHFDW